MAGLVKVHYLKGDKHLFIKGVIIDEDDDFITIQTKKHIFKVNKQYVLVIEQDSQDIALTT